MSSANTPGLKWELEQLAKGDVLAKTILVATTEQGKPVSRSSLSDESQALGCDLKTCGTFSTSGKKPRSRENEAHLFFFDEHRRPVAVLGDGWEKWWNGRSRSTAFNESLLVLKRLHPKIKAQIAETEQAKKSLNGLKTVSLSPLNTNLSGFALIVVSTVALCILFPLLAFGLTLFASIGVVFFR